MNQRVQAGVGGELGVEGGGEQIALAGGDDAAVGQGGQRLGLGADPLDQRRADEDRVDRPVEAS